jgi:hypothetical protein
MIKKITAFYEVRCTSFNCKLNLTQQTVIEFYIYKNVICASSQPVFNADYPQFLWVLSANPL